jgi:hypothetical protein
VVALPTVDDLQPPRWGLREAHQVLQKLKSRSIPDFIEKVVYLFLGLVILNLWQSLIKISQIVQEFLEFFLQKILKSHFLQKCWQTNRFSLRTIKTYQHQPKERSHTQEKYRDTSTIKKIPSPKLISFFAKKLAKTF